MRLFLDTSVLISATASCSGASREIFRRSDRQNWVLITTPYGIEEVERNLDFLSPEAAGEWNSLRSRLLVMGDVLTLDLPSLFEKSKDKPILFGALAWADALLTLDEGDFGWLMESTFYGLAIMTPGSFLRRERGAGKLFDE